MKFWSELRDDYGRRLLTIMAVTPETYTKVIKMARYLGFQSVGKPIPNICHLVYEGKRVGGQIMYFCPKEG